MPRLPKPCKEPGCPELTHGTRCTAHEARRAPQERAYDRRRPGARARGYDRRHEEWRADVLARDRMCRMCLSAPATVADHIVPIRDGGARFDLRNGQGLCGPCHSGPKQSRDKRARAARR